MTSIRSKLASAALILAATWSSPSLALAQMEDPSAPQDAAQAAYQRGREHAKAKRWAEAEKEFAEAYRLRQAWDIAGNLGIAEVELGKFVAAAKHLEESLRTFPGSGKPEHRALIDGAYQKALKQVGRLDIRASEPGATITIDGQAVGVDPLGRVQFVEPGKHVVTAAKGEAKGEKEASPAAGEELSIVLTLASAPTTGPGPVTPPPGGGETESGTPVGAWVLVGAGGAVAVTGGILLAVGLGSQSSAKDDAASIVADGGSCEPATNGFASRCDDALSSASSGSTLAVTGGVLLGVGVAAAAGGLVWMLTSGGESADTAARGVELFPVVGSDTAGLWMKGTY